MNQDERPMIHIRFTKSQLRRVDHVAVDLDLDRARTIEYLVGIALDNLQAKTEELASVG